MSSIMALRCLLRRIPGHHLPRVGRGVPAPPPASRPMSTQSQDEARRVAESQQFEAEIEKLNRFRESLKVRREASIEEVTKMEKKCEEAMEAADRSLDGYIRAIDNLRKVREAGAVPVLCFTGFCVLSALGIDYYDHYRSY